MEYVRLASKRGGLDPFMRSVMDGFLFNSFFGFQLCKPWKKTLYQVNFIVLYPTFPTVLVDACRYQI
jgi:hypothetical protein